MFNLFGNNNETKQDVVRVANNIQDGKIDARLDTQNGVDREMAYSVNLMLDHLTKKVSDTESKAGIVELLPTPIMTIDKEFTVTLLNSSGAQVLDMDQDECIGKKCYELFKTPHCNTGECRCDQAMRTGSVKTSETICDPKGKNIPIRYTGAPLKDSNGNINGAVEYVVDITDTKKALDDAVQKAEYLNNVPTPVMVIDKNMNVQFMNNAGAEAVGKTTEECEGKKCYNLFNTGHCNTDNCQVAKAMKKDSTFTDDTVAKLPSGELPIRYTGAPIKDSNGEIVGGLEYVIDITEENQAVSEVEGLVDDALNGKLSTRGNPDNYDIVGFRNVIKGINNTLDAIVEPLNETKRVAESIADGDLTQSINVETKGDLKEFADTIEEMQENLKNLVENIKESASQVSSTSEELSASSEQLTSSANQISDTITEITNGAQNQSTKIQEVSSTMNDMSTSIQDVSSNAQKTSETVTEVNKLVNEVGEQSKELKSKMDSIQTTSEQTSEVVRELDEKSKKIGEIVNMITNIADQTNLLALNAAIEAARAGEQGRGFAVVADEVRKLAEESSNSAQQIGDLIQEIQNSTGEAVSSMENSSQEIENGSQALDETVGSMSNVVDKTSEADNMVQDIASSAEELSASVEEVTSSVEEVSSIAEESSSSTEEASASVEEQTSSMQELSKSAQDLNQMAEELNQSVESFKVDSSDKKDKNSD
ncbi:MAG: methyl-accepting chemotaxis protein [Methanohalobium sp.]|uniref:methyl-accepting chemotaxis protein n=1 Tax=Methanohalobium sp. TaxID=2837493 RepID=UPI00397C8E51